VALTARARAILWAQWRTLQNTFRRGGGVAWTAIVGLIWYGLWLSAAVIAAKLAAQPGNIPLLYGGLPAILLLVFLYWQVIPLLMAATGASLDLRKLQAYPIPLTQLFAIEVLLRVTGGIEMLLILTGVGVGMLLNPVIPLWAPFLLAPYVAFNLFLSVGMRDLVVRMLARKRVREFAFFFVILLAALPQLLLSRAGPRTEARLRALVAEGNLPGSPWSATANLVNGDNVLASAALVLAWTAAAAAFGWWQFRRTLNFDADAARSGDIRPEKRAGLIERFYRLPSVLFHDPLGAMVEKEVRFLARSPRFRLVFLMGFTFGLVVWLPIAAGQRGASQSFIGSNYLTVVSVYSLLLLSEVCFWNSFGFDRSAAQFYFLAPVPFATVLIGKNLSAMLFIMLEIVSVTAVCAVLGMPIDPLKLAEAYAVAAVISVFLLGAGNMLSVNNARGTNPSSSFRSGAAGRVQAILFVIYPIAFLPAGLAYLARWAFNSEATLFAVLAFDLVIGMVVYRIALGSAVEAAERTKEKMLAALAAGDGPITG
jgi:ABC-2 type transport system permease protein